MANKRADKAIYRYLDTVGDGSGTKVATGDYSTPDEFLISAGTDTLKIERMIVYIEDGAATAYNKYGAMNALTNGIRIRVKNSSGTFIADLDDGLPIKTNGQWGRLCYDSTILGGNSVTVRWTFAKAGQPLTLWPGDSLVVTLSDSMTGLTDHTFRVQGYKASSDG